MSPLSLEGPYISLFSLLRESSPSLPHPSLLLLFFCLSPLDPANPPTRPFSVYTVAKGVLQMLEGLYFGRGFNTVWHKFPLLNNADISTPHKKKTVSVSLLLISSSISVTHPSGIFSPCLGHFLIPSSCIKVVPSSKKSHSSHFPPTQNLPSSSPFSLWTQSLLPLFSLHPVLPHSLAFFSNFFKDNLNPFLFLHILFVFIFALETFLKPFFLIIWCYISCCLHYFFPDLPRKRARLWRHCAVMYRTFTATNHMLLLVTEDMFRIRPSDELKALRRLCFWLLLVNLILWSGWSKWSTSVLWV